MIKILRELHDFIAGGSFVTPVGLVVAVLVAYFVQRINPGAAIVAFVVVMWLALNFALQEKVQ